jgi:hypothetical protein
MPGTTRTPSMNGAKHLAEEIAKKLQDAYDRGASTEVTKFLRQEFARLQKEHDEQLKMLKKQVGL